MPVAASAIYFLNLRGDVLINRLYRDDVGGNMVDAFRMHIMQTKELGTCPVRQIGGCTFLYMRISNVYIVIVVSSNANVACAFKFMVEAVNLFKSYFGGQFDEDAIRNNFVLIYELLDEIMDFGYPQNLSPEILKLYITQEGVRSPFSSKVILDIVESVNLLMSSKDIFESSLTLETSHYDEGYADGYRDGAVSGKRDGYEVGLKHGFELGEELGFYKGLVDVWLSAIRVDPACFSTRVQKSIHQMSELVESYPVQDPESDSIDEMKASLRLKFRAVCASLGVKLEYDGYPKTSQDADLGF